ncbi:uncharacterized protein LOC128205552 [Mya arenaria]|uniref:uncharacterized protein LOC128205552 n=1 Tax=Mya arenaria TaxID=6604 RepID=UPI0022E022ED|nr:uncharacterized protein LOC128205552 [Mya arenaria]XP_052763245.1 uncharacterized protein LOC128205552 [Mya arenaria]
MDCRASIIMRAVIRFPDNKITSTSEHQKSIKRKLLDNALKSSDHVNWCMRVYVYVPDESCHSHITGEFGSVYQRLDKTIIDKIYSLVGDGVRRVDEMERAIIGFTKRQFPSASRLNGRFYPSRKIIRNHMYSAMCVRQFSTEDAMLTSGEGNNRRITSITLQVPKKVSPRMTMKEIMKKLVLKTFSSSINLLGRSVFWRNMVRRSVCWMPPTRPASLKCPCFVCVNTNSGYVVVGSFVLPTETTYHIKRGLAVLKSWNPTWKPPYFITDYDRKEMKAIEETFPGCFTILCDFHREQSWKRWVGPTNGVTHPKEVLELLRSIANSSDEQSFTEAVDALKESSHWNKRLQDWFQTFWLKESKRWVQYHRQSLLNKKGHDISPRHCRCGN